jgi:hypothetical protein
MEALNNIFDELDQLDAATRRAVYDRLAFQVAKPGDFTQAERDIWDGAVAISGERHSLASLFNDRRYTRAKYRRKVEYVLAQLAQGCRHTLSRQQHTVLVDIALRCLAKWLKANGKPILLATMIDHLDDIGDALDLAFPGYASARMLDLLVRFENSVAPFAAAR